MLQDKLEEAIHNQIRDFYFKPTLIVMHPKTWIDLIEDVLGRDSSAFSRPDPNLKYRGIKVLRSLDIEEGVFEVK